MIWVLYELSRNSIFQEKIRSEVLEACDQHGIGPEDDLPLAIVDKLEFTNAFLKVVIATSSNIGKCSDNDFRKSYAFIQGYGAYSVWLRRTPSCHSPHP